MKHAEFPIPKQRHYGRVYMAGALWLYADLPAILLLVLNKFA